MTVDTLRTDAWAAEKYGEWSIAADKWLTVARSVTDDRQRAVAERRASKCERRAARTPTP